MSDVYDNYSTPIYANEFEKLEVAFRRKFGLSLERQAIVYLGVVEEGNRLRHFDEDDCNQVDEADRTLPKEFLTDDEAKRFRSLAVKVRAEMDWPKTVPPRFAFAIWSDGRPVSDTQFHRLCSFIDGFVAALRQEP